ncbi:MAG: DHH family phosphoesterase, partial [Leptospiraceae bacterium]|nr:DHH family phosphoesterase [Leptospiraceae bacterium]
MPLPHSTQSGPRRSARQSTPRPLAAQLSHLKPLLQDPAYRHLIDDPDAFSPEITGLHSPLLLPAMEQAVAYLHLAISSRAHIVVIGDRDVDGVSSTATMGNFLKEQHVTGGGSLEMIVSDEGDDYGLSGGVFERALNSGAGLIILLDMGTSNGPEIEQLHAQGILTIVLDHHQLHERTANPEHCAFVNPMRSPEDERLEHAGKIATAGLVFKFLLGYALSHTKDWYRAYTLESETDQLLAYRCGQFLGEFSSPSAVEHFLAEQNTQSNQNAWEVLPLERHYRITPETRLRILENPRSNGKYILAAVISGRPRLREFALRYADLAAVGIVTDMVPLIGENRALVRMGIGRIGAVSAPGHRSYCPGYAALIQAMNLSHTRVVSRDLSWSIGPALNAAGRMGNTRLALDLLTCQEEPEAKRLARELVRLNEERRRRTARNEALVNQLVEQESHLLDHPILFLYHAELEPGVSGIVATRMVEKHLRPVVYINPDGDYARGSIRTFQQVNVLHLLDAARDLFIQFGGHPEA